MMMGHMLVPVSVSVSVSDCSGVALVVGGGHDQNTSTRQELQLSLQL